MLERLAADLLSTVTGLSVHRAASGSQSGADAGAITATRTIRVEAKRYKDTTTLRERELLGEVAQAFQKDPLLEAWILVTTREAPEQTISALRKFSVEHGAPIFCLDWSGPMPILAALCASQPDLVKHSCGDKAATAAQKLADEIDATQVIERLRHDFDEWSTGWAITSKRCHDAIKKILSNRDESRAFFRQDLAIADTNSSLIQRKAIYRKFDAWEITGEPGRPLLIIGEEGRGKSWVLSSWLYGRNDDETVILYCSSSEFRSLRKYTVDAVLSHALSLRTCSLNEAYWSKRIDRYKNAPEPTKPRILIVIDGLNEAATADWIGFFLDAQRDIWQSRIQIIASCRSNYFENNLQSGRPWTKSPFTIDIPDYTVEERNEALKLQGVEISGLSASVLELAKVPRICRLIARMSEQLKDIEHITYERLLFEYGKRFDPDARISLSDDIWHAFLRELASATRKGDTTSKRSQIREWIDIQDGDNLEVILNDIIDGRLIRYDQREPGVVDIDKDIVLAANGLALWKLIEKAQFEGQNDISELLARELDPLGGIDEKVRIVMFAVAAALLSDSSTELTRPIVTALILEGVTSQNIGTDEEERLVSYARILPAGYLEALSILARKSRHDEAEVLLYAIQSVADTENVQNAIIESATDWIHIVSLDIRHESSRPEEQRTRTKNFTRWLGQIPSTGETTILGVKLLIEDESNHHNLPIYAIRLLQYCPLSQASLFWRTFGIVSVLERSYLVHDFASWIVRLNKCDYTETSNILRSVSEFLSKQPPITGADENFPKRAAAQLQWLEGDEKSSKLARELVPEPDGWEHIQKEIHSPNTSMFQVNRCHLESVLNKSKQNTGHLISRAIQWWPDPEFKVPASFIERVTSYTKSIDFSEVRSSMGTTKIDHDLSQAYPALARCSPSTLSELYRRKISELHNRTGEEWAYLASDIIDQWLIATSNDCKTALLELKRRNIGECKNNRQEWARTTLRIIACAKSKPEVYVQGLISDGADSMINVFIYAFRRISENAAEKLLLFVKKHNDPKADWIYINLLAHTNTPISNEVAQYLLYLTQSNFSGIRRLALYTLAAINKKQISTLFSNSGWTWRNAEDDTEQDHGSNILLQSDPPLPLTELFTRIAPWLLPKAAYLRQSIDERKLIAQTVTGLLSTKEPPPIHPFEENFDIEPNSFQKSHTLLNLDAPESNTFPTDEIQSKDLEKARQEANRLIIKERGNNLRLYGIWIDSKYIASLLDAAPEELDCWLYDIDDGGNALTQQIRNAAGFYTSLCQYLLINNPKLGIKLWRIIDKMRNSTLFTNKIGLNVKLSMVFECPENENTKFFWDELWDLSYTNNNLALFEIILAAEMAGRNEWLDEIIIIDGLSSLPWQNERALFASSLRINPELDRMILNRDLGLKTHRQVIEEKTEMFAARSVWQRHWLLTYFKAKSHQNALAAFTLFLEVADMRWPLIVDKLKKDGINIADNRNRYLNMRRQDIKKATKKFNDDLGKHFLGGKVCDGVWPWAPVKPHIYK